MNCISTNLIEIIGYQLEKVHSGLLAWILDSKNAEISVIEKINLISKISSKNIVNFPNTIQTYLEWACGRKIKIDLVVECDYRNRKKILGIEFKVDSIPNREQLEATENALEQEYGKGNVEVVLILMGVSSKATKGNDVNGYKIIRLNDLLSYLHDINHQNVLIWKKAIEAELNRHENILLEIKKSNYIWDLKGRLIEKGYRWPFPVFYLLYARLRDDCLKSNDWSIYSGNNNPVMNANKSWKVIAGVDLYVEFCWEDLIVKCGNWDLKRSKGWVKKLRDIVYQEMKDRIGAEVQKCQNRYGKSNSLCKISFSFAEMYFQQIADKTNIFLSKYLTMIKIIETKIKWV